MNSGHAVRTGRGQCKLIRIPRDTAQHVPTRFPSILRYLPPPHDYVFQKGGAASRTARLVQEFGAGKPPDFSKKEGWPSASPGLNVIGYYVACRVKGRVGKKQPNRTGSLELAIRQSADSIPLDMIQRPTMCSISE